MLRNGRKDRPQFSSHRITFVDPLSFSWFPSAGGIRGIIIIIVKCAQRWRATDNKWHGVSSRACIDPSFHRAPLRCQLDQRVEDNIKDKRNRDTREERFFEDRWRERERGADRKRCVEPSITERRGDERGVQLNRSRSASDREREREREREKTKKRGELRDSVGKY